MAWAFAVIIGIPLFILTIAVILPRDEMITAIRSHIIPMKVSSAFI